MSRRPQIYLLVRAFLHYHNFLWQQHWPSHGWRIDWTMGIVPIIWVTTSAKTSDLIVFDQVRIIVLPARFPTSNHRPCRVSKYDTGFPIGNINDPLQHKTDIL
jgi:hypothetical protein